MACHLTTCQYVFCLKKISLHVQTKRIQATGMLLPVQVFEKQNVITYTDEGYKAIGYPTVIDLELHADLHI